MEADFEQAQAFEEALAPKLRMTGQTGALQQFGDYLGGKNLEKASDVLLLWTSAGVLEVLLSAAEQQASFAQVCSHSRCCWQCSSSARRATVQDRLLKCPAALQGQSPAAELQEHHA